MQSGAICSAGTFSKKEETGVIQLQQEDRRVTHLGFDTNLERHFIAVLLARLDVDVEAHAHIRLAVGGETLLHRDILKGQIPDILAEDLKLRGRGLGSRTIAFFSHDSLSCRQSPGGLARAARLHNASQGCVQPDGRCLLSRTTS